jgi:serine/threonine protein phosphatase 1
MPQLGKVLTKPSGRRMVISDIHGCIHTLRSLWERLHVSEEDQIIFLGDYVNKGVASREVLDFLRSKSETFNTFFLRGNHDQKLLDYYETNQDELRKELIGLNCNDLVEISSEDRKIYKDFLASTSHFFISDSFILVHAGFDFELANPFLGKEAMLNIRGFTYESKKAQSKTIVHGHFPFSLTEILRQIEKRSKVLPIDNGCVYPDREGQGNLLCLTLDTMELIKQPFIG